MPQAVVDPGELRQFAQTLKKFNVELVDRASGISGQLDALGATWRDQENIKFTEEFKQHLTFLLRFVEANEQHIPYLMRKAERIEEYLQQR